MIWDGRLSALFDTKSYMHALWQDLRFGLRTLLKSPGFAAASIFTLALGIGANTAIFSFANALLLRPLQGVSDPALLVHLLRTEDKSASDRVSYQDSLDYAEQNSTLAGIAMQHHTDLHLSTGGEAERVIGAIVTGNYFEVLGVKAARGRLLQPVDARAEGSNPVAVLSHRLWRDRFLRVVGETVKLNGLGFTIIGIAADGFTGTVIGERVDLWIPITMWRQADPEMASAAANWNVDWFNERDSLWLKAFGRLKPGVTIEQAQADLSVIAQRLARDHPQTNQKAGVRLAAGLGLPPDVRSRFGQFVKLPVVVAGVVLLIVCANIAGMMLARAGSRQKEIGIRLALGANHWRILRQLLTENLLLALVGGLLGLVLGRWLSDWLRLSLPETYFNTPLNFDLALDGRVLGFTLMASVLTSVFFGLAPAWHLLKLDLVPLLKEQPNRHLRAGRIRPRQMLVVIQIALSLVLLVSAGLCIRTLQNARAIDTGFETERVLTTRIDLGRQNYTETQGQTLYQRLIERMESLPGVQAASLALHVPLSGMQPVTRIHPEGRPPENGRPQVSFNVVTPRYLETVGVRLLFGRHFSTQDDQQQPSRVAIVNEALARRYWPNENPIGKRFRFGASNPDAPQIEIVGVARDTSVANLFAPPRMYFYLPLAQHYRDQAILHLRTISGPDQFVAPMRREIASLDSSLPLYDVKTLTGYIDDALTPQRLAALLLSGLGALAMILSAMGLYGTMAYEVELRTHEIGIRMALGAQTRDVLRLVLGQGMVLTIAGVIIGTIAAFALTRLIKGLLFGVNATDPLTFAVIVILLMAVGGLACYIPARQAIKVDLVKPLRRE